MKKSLFSLAAALVMTIAVTPAYAQQNRNCAPRKIVVAKLAEGYGETRQSMGLGGQGAVVETFASSDTGTWTITVTMPNGMTCMIASGQSFEALIEALPPKEDDA